MKPGFTRITQLGYPDDQIQCSGGWITFAEWCRRLVAESLHAGRKAHIATKRKWIYVVAQPMPPLCACGRHRAMVDEHGKVIERDSEPICHQCLKEDAVFADDFKKLENRYESDPWQRRARMQAMSGLPVYHVSNADVARGFGL